MLEILLAVQLLGFILGGGAFLLRYDHVRSCRLPRSEPHLLPSNAEEDLMWTAPVSARTMCCSR